ncbi:MAG: hypothetical protein JWQ11_324 [Rhizobacter sp.]|nr:hypothetical protein [Rhizobacter sp.]
MTDDSLAGLKPQHPSLYVLAADGRSLDFLYARCTACAGFTFPADSPGCMHCGASLVDAEAVRKPGGGQLLEWVTLHVALVPGLAAPSIAADIRIEDGIVEEGVIDVADEALLDHGMTLRAVAVPTAGGDSYSCRFRPWVDLSAPARHSPGASS